MAAKGESRTTQMSAIAKNGRHAQSVQIAATGIASGRQCAAFLSALIGDVMVGRVTHGQANAATNAVGKLLKVVEMQYRYGTNGDGGSRELQLTQ